MGTGRFRGMGNGKGNGTFGITPSSLSHSPDPYP